jgi:hypothetical protein
MSATTAMIVAAVLLPERLYLDMPVVFPVTGSENISMQEALGLPRPGRAKRHSKVPV